MRSVNRTSAAWPPPNPDPAPVPDPLQLLTPQQVADLLGIKVGTLAHARSGRGRLRLPVVWIGPRTPRYRRSDVAALIEARTFANTAQSHAAWRRI